MQKEIRIWYDKDGEYLEVLFERKKGYFRESGSQMVMEKVDEDGNITGFSVLKVRASKSEPLSLSLKNHVA